MLNLIIYFQIFDFNWLQTDFLAKYTQNIAHMEFMTCTGNKSSETILGLHACRFDNLENFGITFWEKPAFMTALLLDIRTGPEAPR